MRTIALIILFCLFTACDGRQSLPDWSDCPRLVTFRADRFPLPAEQPLELTFDRPVFPQAEEGYAAGVYLVPQQDAGACNPLCPVECHEGRCFLSEVDGAFLDDATGGDLSITRRKKTLSVRIEAEGATWRVRPEWGSLTPSWRYDLVLSPRVRDAQGLPLVGVDGGPGAFALPFSTARADDLEAAVTWLAPTVPARNVPQNLAFLAVKIQGGGATEPGIFILESEEQSVLELTATPFPSGCIGELPGVECLLLWMPGTLEPDTAYELRSIRRVRLSGGRFLLPWGRLGTFRTGEMAWLYPPNWEESAVQEVTGCLHLSGTLEGQALLWLEADGAAVSPALFVRFSSAELAVRLAGLREHVPGLRVHGIGLDGSPLLGSRHDPGPADPAGLTVVLTRLHPNPVGPEPAQEFIELENLSDTTVELEGYELTDALDKAGDLLPAFALAPGARVRVAGKNYDPDAEGEPPPEGDLIVLESSLANAGLANGGEPLYLFDAFGWLVSRYGGWIDTGDAPGLSVVRRWVESCDVATSWVLR
ncbi:lamin tail domain-containing protein [Myxococcota bacterium]|nr:lamin tail domain-containing protein [Myxococcota bacterium]